VLGVGAALVVECAILVALAYADPAIVVGIPAAVAAAVGGTVAVVFGPVDGALVAFVGAIAFAAAGSWGAGELLALAVWPAIVVPIGLFARRVAEQRAALDELVARQEVERRRLALELHDETVQTLAGALLTLRRVDGDATPADVQATAEELRSLLVDTIERLRALAVELLPKALDDFGLGAAVGRLVAGFGERLGVPVEVELSEGERLDVATELALFRVVQDALAEAGGARSLRVALTRPPGHAVLEVEFRGMGESAARPAFASTRERLRLVGGRLTVNAGPEGSTTVRAVVPATA
jgi:signal transduction histidine kinase